MATISEISKGMVIDWRGDLWAIGEYQHVSPGKGQTFTRIKLKNLKTGKVVENTFKSNESLDFVDVSKKRMQYLFNDGTSYTFMDMHNYEQVMVGADIIGDSAKYLAESLEVAVVMLDGAAITVEIPLKVTYTVAETEPAVKGDTASGNVQKNATADNGLAIRVPIFVKEGDKVVINTETGDYVERAN